MHGMHLDLLLKYSKQEILLVKLKFLRRESTPKSVNTSLMS